MKLSQNNKCTVRKEHLAVASLSYNTVATQFDKCYETWKQRQHENILKRCTQEKTIDLFKENQKKEEKLQGEVLLYIHFPNVINKRN